jgi:uncharacterized phage protein gp47/JayE
MNLSLKGFPQLIEDMSAALQSSATALVDVSVGSVVRAIFEANASVVLWLQWLLLQVLQTTRASTSTGADLDSWMADFSLQRLSTTTSTGIVTFSRYTLGSAATIPAGSIVKTADGLLSFAVVEEGTLSIWQPSISGYVIPSGVAAADIPIVCVTAGSAGNVLAGTINVVAASLPGIDQVNNANPLSNGADAETDDAFRIRFRGYLASRSRATLGALQNAIAGVRQGLDVAIMQNTGPDGALRVGTLLVIVDDGSGFPSTDLLSNVANAVDSVRPVGTAFAVVAPQVLVLNVALTAEFASSSGATVGVAAIQNYIGAYLNTLPIGKAASITRAAQQAYRYGPDLLNIAGVAFNGSSTDVIPSARTVIKAGRVEVSVR